MSRHVHKSHNVLVLIYHIVCPAKYRRVVFDAWVDKEIKEVWYVDFPSQEGHLPGKIGNDPRTLGREAGRLIRGFGPDASSTGEPVKQNSSRLSFRCAGFRTAS
jgi:hypothetical protein